MEEPLTGPRVVLITGLPLGAGGGGLGPAPAGGNGGDGGAGLVRPLDAVQPSTPHSEPVRATTATGTNASMYNVMISQ